MDKNSNQNIYKQALAGISNQNKRQGQLEDVIVGAHAVIGVSGPDNISARAIRKMAKKPIVFAMANPTPEIMPDKAKAAGAYITATGRSDFNNQINNVLAFPGIFRAVVKGRLKKITYEMKIAASDALASLVPKPTVDNIIPSAFYPKLAEIISQAVLKAS